MSHIDQLPPVTTCSIEGRLTKYSGQSALRLAGESAVFRRRANTCTGPAVQSEFTRSSAKFQAGGIAVSDLIMVLPEYFGASPGLLHFAHRNRTSRSQGIPASHHLPIGSDSIDRVRR